MRRCARVWHAVHGMVAVATQPPRQTQPRRRVLGRVLRVLFLSPTSACRTAKRTTEGTALCWGMPMVVGQGMLLGNCCKVPEQRLFVLSFLSLNNKQSMQIDEASRWAKSHTYTYRRGRRRNGRLSCERER